MISIVITSHNRPEGLDRALKSCLPTGCQIVVVCSGNDTRCIDLARKHKGIIVTSFTADPGNNAAWLAGVKMATNPWVLILHDDDWLITEKFVECLPQIHDAMHRGAGFVAWNGLVKIPGNPDFINRGAPGHPGDNNPHGLLLHIKNDTRSPSPVLAVHRKDHLIETLTEFQEKCQDDVYKVNSKGTMVSGNDTLIWLRACERYSWWSKIEDCLVCCNGDANSTTIQQSDPNSRMHKAYAAIREYWELFPLENHKPIIQDVSAVLMEALDPDGAARVLRYMSKKAYWKRLVLLSPRRPENCKDIEFIQVPYFQYIGYSTLSVKGLGHYVTGNTLVVQKDGFPVRHHLWCRSWMEYDYIGAPWPEHWGLRTEQRVGNSGCTLRSGKFNKACIECPVDHNNENDQKNENPKAEILCNDDVWMCQRDDVKAFMNEQRIRYAPIETAKFFSIECKCVEHNLDESDIFGFHGFQYNEQVRKNYKELIQ